MKRLVGSIVPITDNYKPTGQYASNRSSSWQEIGEVGDSISSFLEEFG